MKLVKQSIIIYDNKMQKSKQINQLINVMWK